LREIHAPLAVVSACGSLIHGPDVVKHQLHKHGLQVPSLEVLGAENSFGLGIKVEITPKNLL
jgi:hypothetical protein